MASGYLHTSIESIKKVADISGNFRYELKFGAAIVKTDYQNIQDSWTAVYLLQIPQDAPNLSFRLYNEENKQVGECCLNVKPFLAFEFNVNIISSDFVDETGKIIAHINFKLSYFSSKYGKLKLKILGIFLTENAAEKFKNLSLRFKLGPITKNLTDFSQTFELIILNPNFNLQVNLLSSNVSIGQNVVNHIQQTGLVSKQIKAWQQNLFGEGKNIGKLKFECQLIA